MLKLILKSFKNILNFNLKIIGLSADTCKILLVLWGRVYPLHEACFFIVKRIDGLSKGQYLLFILPLAEDIWQTILCHRWKYVYRSCPQVIRLYLNTLQLLWSEVCLRRGRLRGNSSREMCRAHQTYVSVILYGVHCTNFVYSSFCESWALVSCCIGACEVNRQCGNVALCVELINVFILDRNLGDVNFKR